MLFHDGHDFNSRCRSQLDLCARVKLNLMLTGYRYSGECGLLLAAEQPIGFVSHFKLLSSPFLSGEGFE